MSLLLSTTNQKIDIAITHPCNHVEITSSAEVFKLSTLQTGESFICARQFMPSDIFSSFAWFGNKPLIAYLSQISWYRGAKILCILTIAYNFIPGDGNRFYKYTPVV